MDDSTSILRGKDNWDNVLKFIGDFLDGISIGTNLTRVAAITFSDRAETEFYLDDYETRAELKQAFQKIKITTGNTNIYRALREMRTEVFETSNGDRIEATNIGIVLTDGVANKDASKIEDEVNAVMTEDGVEIIAVGITDKVADEQLKLIAPDAENRLRVEDFDKLMTVVENVVQQACHPTTAPTTTSTTSTTTTPEPTTTTTDTPSTTASKASVTSPAVTEPVACEYLMIASHVFISKGAITRERLT